MGKEESDLDFQSLLDALEDDSSDGQKQAFQKLHELASEEGKREFPKWKQEYAVSLRLKRLVPKLLEMCVCKEVGSLAGFCACVPMHAHALSPTLFGIQLQGSLKRAALSICVASVHKDIPNFTVTLVKEGMIRKLSKLTSIPLETSSTVDAHYMAGAIELLFVALKPRVKAVLPHVNEELFTCGHMAHIARALDHHDHEVRRAFVDFSEQHHLFAIQAKESHDRDLSLKRE
eukprot:1159984-Pelagomonas_calceolata.AAC.2